MGISAGSLLPGPVRRALRPAWMSPPIQYTKHAVDISLRRLFRVHGTSYRAEVSPLLADFERYETLFAASEANLRDLIGPYRREMRWFVGKVYNGAFQSIDAELYYSAVRTYRPARIIEVGTGYSAHFGMEAIRRNGHGEMTVIDPGPRRRPPRAAKHMRCKVEDVDVGLFGSLQENDILFIDSSHTTEEARYHVETILPSLAPGVVIHHHDFVYPYALYYFDDPKEFGEPDVLLDFYDRCRDEYEVLVGAAYVRHVSPATIGELVRSYAWDLGRLPGSLWARKLT